MFPGKSLLRHHGTTVCGLIWRISRMRPCSRCMNSLRSTQKQRASVLPSLTTVETPVSTVSIYEPYINISYNEFYLYYPHQYSDPQNEWTIYLLSVSNIYSLPAGSTLRLHLAIHKVDEMHLLLVFMCQEHFNKAQFYLVFIR